MSERTKQTIAYIVTVGLAFVAFLAGDVAGEHNVTSRTRVVEFDFNSNASLYGPYFGECFRIGSKHYCATDADNVTGATR